MQTILLCLKTSFINITNKQSFYFQKSLFCTVLILLFWIFSARHFKKLYHLLSFCWESFCQIIWNFLERSWYFFCHEMYLVMIIKILKGQFLQKQFKKELIFISYNHFHNILWIFDVLSNFPFTTNKTMRDYFL